MPKLMLMLDRKPVQVYDLDQTVIRVGRSQGMDVLIDNVSVSRRQAEIRKEGEGWIVHDLGSSNGTFVNGEKVTADRPLQAGDEISFGKFSLFFERVAAQPVAREAVVAAPPRRSPPATTEGPLADATRFLIGRPLLMSSEEAEQLQKAAAQRRQAHVQGAPAGERGTHDLEGGGIVVGRTAGGPGLRRAPWWRGWLRVTVVMYVIAVLVAWVWDTQHPAMPQRDYLRQATAVSFLALLWTAAVMLPVVAIASAVRWVVQGFRPDSRRP